MSVLAGLGAALKALGIDSRVAHPAKGESRPGLGVKSGQKRSKTGKNGQPNRVSNKQKSGKKHGILWISCVLDTISGMIRGNATRTFSVRFAGESKDGLMHDSRTVANRFLALAREQGIALTPMQLLKLVYIAHGWMLGLYGRPLIREPVEAWQYGPVIRTLYNSIRKYGARNVTDDIRVDTLDHDLTELEDDVIQQVWKAYGNKNGVALSRLTHAPGTPWAQTYAPGEFGTPIPQDIIADHYQRLAAH